MIIKNIGKILFNIPNFFCYKYKVLWLRSLGAKIGAGSIVNCKVPINKAKNLVVGDYCYIDKEVNIALHNKVIIGDRVVINSKVNLLTGSHDISHSAWPNISDKIEICDYAWLATNCLVLPGVKISEGTVVAASSVVTKNYPPYSILASNPAKLIGTRVKGLNYNPTENVSYIACFKK
ncbi:acyltransferase [Salinimonas marina]|uniref:Acyltransferase n=1 Tax=Salinimonas marina TaxID=2785918 RepID=A0A7S9HCQ5_9ALTE|nr:acyltransferase [Salinimonas marina]QPG05137.1 acyltransferase [Salinimonas marina]